MQRFLITGANGQLGKCIQNVVADGRYERRFIFACHDDLDITDRNAVTEIMNRNDVEVVVNCAAYTNVAAAETGEGSMDAYKCNCEGVGILTEACRNRGIYLIHISTDYVFDGTKNTPYMPSDNRNPFTEYGKTKMYGEDYVLGYGKGIVLRTSWLFSEYGKNFFTTIQGRLMNGKNSSVVCDQIGNPTYAGDLADFIVRLLLSGGYEGKRGAYHYSNSGTCSWYDLACLIEYLNNSKGINTGISRIQPVTSVEYSSGVIDRPAYSALNTDKLREFTNKTPRSWIFSVSECYDKYMRRLYGTKNPDSKLPGYKRIE